MAHCVPEIAAEKWPVWPMIIVRISTTLAHMSSKTPIDPSHPFSDESVSFFDTHLIIEQGQAILIFSIGMEDSNCRRYF